MSKLYYIKPLYEPQTLYYAPPHVLNCASWYAARDPFPTGMKAFLFLLASSPSPFSSPGTPLPVVFEEDEA